MADNSELREAAGRAMRERIDADMLLVVSYVPTGIERRLEAATGLRWNPLSKELEKSR